MVNIKNLHIYYYAFPTDEQVRLRKNGKRFEKVIRPTDNSSTLAMKQDVARFITTIKSRYDKYYVVAEITTDKGTPAFRPIIPMTFLH